ncbi:oxidoreductase [Scenedesmus sp. NREL 46B-D3]|nr:oxidoreductase [Scenedesmus sp. NREL 46B-D3]
MLQSQCPHLGLNCCSSYCWQHIPRLCCSAHHVACRSMGKQQQAGGSPLQSLKLTHKKLKPAVINDHMLLVPGVLTPHEAQQCIDAAEGLGFEHQGSRGAAYGEAYRDNHRISVQDPALAEQLWSATGLQHTMAGVTVDGLVPIGLNANIRFYRYSRGQKFGRHIDDSVEVAPGQHTGYTLLVYLSGPLEGAAGTTSKGSKSSCSSSQVAASSGKGKRKAPGAGGSQPMQITSSVQDLVGGETVFYGPRSRVVASVAPAPGLALLHLHGEERCLEHEGAEVQQGVKYVLRSDVVFGAPR